MCFSVCWKGEGQSGGGGGEEGVWDVEAPDTDPLYEEQREGGCKKG